MVFGFGGGPIRRERDGTFTIRLSEPEQILLKSLLAQLRTLLKLEGGSEITDESGVRRLFPTAHALVDVDRAIRLFDEYSLHG